MQVWTGGHDNKLCALNDQCKAVFHVGTLKDNGEVAQPGGTKAVIGRGWNVWVFGIKSVSIYMAHCLSSQVATEVSRAPCYCASRHH